MYKIDQSNVSSILDISIMNYKNLEKVIVIYNDSKTIKVFLNLLLQKHARITNKKEADDILIMNECIFL